MSRLFLALGALSGGIAVAAGAFAAHALKARLSPDLLAVFDTAVRYQMFHALALLVVAAIGQHRAGRWLTTAGWLFVIGTLVFSGSLYALSLSGERWLGALTPFGGLAFLAGWSCLAAAAWRRPGDGQS